MQRVRGGGLRDAGRRCRSLGRDCRQDSRGHGGADVAHGGGRARRPGGGDELLGAGIRGSGGGRGQRLLLLEDVCDDSVPGRDARAKVDARAPAAPRGSPGCGATGGGGGIAHRRGGVHAARCVEGWRSVEVRRSDDELGGAGETIPACCPPHPRSPAAVRSASCCRAALSSAWSCATDPSVSSLTTARLRTSLARAANLSVLSVSAKQSSVGESAAMRAVLLLPPSVSRRSLRCGGGGGGELWGNTGAPLPPLPSRARTT